MSTRKLSILGLFCVAAVTLLLQQAGAFSLRELFGFGEDRPAAVGNRDGKSQPETVTSGDINQPAADTEVKASLTYEDIRRLLANAGADQQQDLLGDAEKFRRFAEQEARNASLLAAARANNLHENEEVRFLMQRAADNVLREIYLKRLINNKIPDEFPTGEQVREYYEKNREQFRLGDRIHVWQVFLPIEDGMDAEAIDAVETRAREITQDIRSGKISFSRAALENSAHHPSRNNGGYMGLVKVEELRPELTRPVLALKEGKVGDPVRTDQGMHILKKGETVAGRDVELEEIRGQIRDLLINQANNQLHQAILEKAAETYPVELQKERIEEWRLRLRTGTPQSEPAAPAK